MNIFKKFGLTARFISWFLFIGIVPMIIVGYLSYSSSQRALEQDAVSKLNSIHTSLANHITQYFNDQKELIFTFSHNPGIEGNMKDAVKLQEEVNHLIKEHTEFYDVMIIDKYGKIIASNNPKEIGMDKSQDAYFVSAKEKPYIKDVYLSSTTGEIGFTISAPIGVDEGGFNGAIVIRYKLDTLNSIVSEADADIGKSADVFLVDSNNYAMTDTLINRKDAVLKQKIETDAANQCLAGKEYEGVVAKDYRGIEVLGSYGTDLQTSIGKKWCLVSKLDKAEVNAPVIVLRNQILMITGIIALAILGIAVFASKSTGNFIKKPISRAVDQMLAAVQQLSSSTLQTSSASQQNSSIAQQVAAGATQQSQQAGEVASGIAQITAATTQMSKSAKELAEFAANSSRNTQAAGEKSEQINKAVDLITNVAEQTNLLALNAAIEAARAGDAGRGFAVVADEVRKLAESSGKSAEDIKQVVKDVSTQLLQTTTSVEQISAKIQEVSAGINQQAASVAQMSKTMESISVVSRQNASASQQLSASIQQQSAANQQVAASTQQLESLSEELQKLVGYKEVKKGEKVKEEAKEEKPENPEPSSPEEAKHEESVSANREEIESHLAAAKEHIDKLKEEEHQNQMKHEAAPVAPVAEPADKNLA